MSTSYLYVICFVGVFLAMGMLFLVAAIRIVPEYKRLDVYRLGRYIGEKGPGLVILIPVIDRGVTKDLGKADPTPSQRLVGVVGETQTSVYTDGKVRLATGEVWDAASQAFIPAGERVRVVRMVLEVEKEAG